MVMDYGEFIRSKRIQTRQYGFDVAVDDLNPNAFEWQKRVIQWSLKRGRSALFLDTGLGKTLCQLNWAQQVVEHTGGRVLIHCPIGVRMQTAGELRKFGIECDITIADSQDDCPSQGIVIANYEKLHKFDSNEFDGVVLDESQILKGIAGKTKDQLCREWAGSRFRLACTATPSPNDHMELGNHAEFLGVCSHQEMLSKYFVNDTGDTKSWRLKGHSTEAFWDWVCTWAACVTKPSDIGGSDDGYILPELNEYTELVHVPYDTKAGMLFDSTEVSATNIHDEKRRTSPYRAEKTAEIVASVSGSCVVWCDTNYEADDLVKMIPGAVDIRGSMTEQQKENSLTRFANGDDRVIITKPTIAGAGLNWQHCCNMVFHAINYSFEQRYQAIRRCWRFGQTKPVNVWSVTTDTEHAMQNAVRVKSAKHEDLQRSMRDAMQRSELYGTMDVGRTKYTPEYYMEIPKWLR